MTWGDDEERDVTEVWPALRLALCPAHNSSKLSLPALSDTLLRSVSFQLYKRKTTFVQAKVKYVVALCA